MNKKEELLNGAIAYVAESKAAEIAGEELIETDDTALRNAKIADYNNAQILANAIGYQLTDAFQNALSIQSKKPLYAIENPGLWFTEDTNTKIKIEYTGFQSNNTLPDEINGEQTYYSKSLQSLLMYKEGTITLEYILLISEAEENNGEYVGEDIVQIAYIFKNSESENKYITKNTIYQSDIIDGYYRTFTVCNVPVIKWEEKNGSAYKYFCDVETNNSLGETCKEARVVSFSFNDFKRSALLIPTGAKKLTPKELQSKIIALQTLAPKVEQLSEDTNPSWVAKRLSYDKYGIVSEDVTLDSNGESYYWDIGNCWKVREINEIATQQDVRLAPWYWEIAPYLPGAGESYSSADKKDMKFVNDDLDLTNGKLGKDAQTVNVLPSVVADKSYAAIICDENFINNNFKTNGKKGVYFLNSQACSELAASGQVEQTTGSGNHAYNNEDQAISRSTDEKIKKRQFIHPYDLDACVDINTRDTCFFNNEGQTPNNGNPIEAKDKIFDVYFLSKYRFTQNETLMQYDIIETLKTGKRENSKDKDGKLIEGQEYTATKYKRWLDEGTNQETEALQKLIREINKSIDDDINSGYIENFTLTEDEYNNTKRRIALSDGSIEDVKIYEGYEIEKEYKRYKETGLPVEKQKLSLTIIEKPDETQEFHTPVDLLACNYEFTVHENSKNIKDSSGASVAGTYYLSIGYEQERISKSKPVEIFKRVFKDFNKESIPQNIRAQVPYWREVSSYIILNENFVNTFFEKKLPKDISEDDEKIFKEAIKLGLVKQNYRFKEEFDYTSHVSGFDVSLKLSKEEVEQLKAEIKEAVDSKEYKKDFIDSKVDYVCDRFYEFVCDVWGNTDSDGNKRVKSYYVRGTPFELREVKEEGKEDIEIIGFDARDLIDYIIMKSFINVNEEYTIPIIFNKLKTYFQKHKNIEIGQKEFEDIATVIENGVSEAIKNHIIKYDQIYNDEKKEWKKEYEKSLNAMLLEEKTYEAVVDIIGGTTAGVAVSVILFNSVAINAAVSNALGAAAGVLANKGLTAYLTSLVLKGLGVAAGSCAAGIFAVVAAVVIITATIIISQVKKSRNARTAISDDYVYKFTCRARRAIRQYSMTTRGPLAGEKVDAGTNSEGKNYDFGDAEQVTSYYNWLATPGHGQPSGKNCQNKVNAYYNGAVATNCVLTDNYDGRVMVIIPSTEEAISDDEAYSMFSSSVLQKIEEFIQTWMGKKKKEEIEQKEIPIQSYYDFYSGMTPFIEVGFRMGLGVCGRKKNGDDTIFLDENGEPIMYVNGDNAYGVKKTTDGYEKDESNSFKKDSDEYRRIANDNFKTINSIDYPYFKSLKIVDNGVKKATLTLFDPDFASYTTGIEKYTGSDEVFSLETLIRASLRSSVFIQEETTDNYDNVKDTEEIKSDYLKIDESLCISPTNLKIRYGYADKNPILDNTDTYFNIGDSERNTIGRWYNTDKWGSVGNNFEINEVKKYIQDGEITNASGGWITLSDSLKPTANDQETVTDNSSGSTASFENMLKSWAQTCETSRTINFMITKFSSNLQASGIEYNIEAIESKDANIMRTRFLQRYAEITANPEEVLYHLMHIFNEDNNGNNVKASRAKIILISDEEDEAVPAMRDKLNMKFDTKMLDEEELDGTEAQDIYEKAYQEQELTVDENTLKKITLTLGGASATRNYGNPTDKKKPLYKTMAQLMNEFCNLCPPKKIVDKRESIYDNEGNNVLENQDSTVARPLKWFSVEDTSNNITYVCLYYRTVLKVPRIRVYTWGPNNPNPSCVTNIQISNSTEFGVLTGVRSFDADKNMFLSRTAETTEETAIAMPKENSNEAWKKQSAQVFGTANYIGVNAREYDNALSSSMYTADMTILGDPFWSFDGLLQPCTYPIKLNIIIPQNEFTRRADAEGKYQDELSVLRNTFNNREAKGEYWYKEGWQLNEDHKITQNNNVKVKQALHESSGYYVVKEINQEISTNGFITKLKLISYPNIQKDVLAK